MKIYNSVDEFKSKDELSLALGTFDGFHRAHRQVIENMRCFAQKHHLKTAIFAFSNIPKNLNKGSCKKKAVKNILSIDDKLDMAREMDIEHFLNIEFSNQMKNMSREEFLTLLIEDLHVKAISVGYNFRFGKGAKGNTAWLKKQAAERGVEVVVCDEVKYEGRAISSTKIRKSLSIGNVELANRLLGYSFFVKGRVIHGLKNGRKIGFPTANISEAQGLDLLKKGVYITDVVIDQQVYRGVSNLGHKPTVGECDLSLETHIIDFDGDIYEKEIQVRFLKMIRPEMKFKSFEQLSQRIAHDRNLAIHYER